MHIRTPRTVTVGAAAPVQLNDTTRMPASGGLNCFYSGGDVRYSPDPAFVYADGFPLISDTVQTIPSSGNVYALSAIGTVDVIVMDGEG